MKQKIRRKPNVQTVRNAWNKEHFWNKDGSIKPRTTNYRVRKYTKRKHLIKI